MADDSDMAKKKLNLYLEEVPNTDLLRLFTGIKRPIRLNPYNSIEISGLVRGFKQEAAEFRRKAETATNEEEAAGFLESAADYDEVAEYVSDKERWVIKKG